MPDLSSINPFSNFNIGLGTLGNILLLGFLALLVVGGVGVLIIIIVYKKRYIYKIPLWKTVNGRGQQIAEYKAKPISISKAGDRLWYVGKIKKFISPATIQSGINKFHHWQRSDGEWINFEVGDLDANQKRAGVKYIHQDMRATRVATANLLEQRLMNKGFWDKYGDMIIHIIFYLIICISLVVIFWQWSGIVEKTGELVSELQTAQERMIKLNGGDSGVVPALIFLLLRRREWGP